MSDEQAVVNSWDELFNNSDEETEYLYVVIGARRVRLGSLPSDQLLVWLEDQDDPEKAKTNAFALIAKSLVNEAGERIGKLDEVVKLRSKQPAAIKKLREGALQVNGLRAGQEKNEPGEASSATSPSDSPATSAE